MSCKKHCNNNRYSNIDFDFGIPNRFDLEDTISSQMEITNNLNTIIEDVLDGDRINLDPDELVNTLQGIVNLHTMKHNKLWQTFVNLFRLDSDLDKLYNSFSTGTTFKEEDNND